MNFNYNPTSGVVRDRAYRQFGHYDRTETGLNHAVTLDLQFRLATNGIIVNTLVNDEPLITTSAGLFHR